jgi:hypothetical protein
MKKAVARPCTTAPPQVGQHEQTSSLADEGLILALLWRGLLVGQDCYRREGPGFLSTSWAFAASEEDPA